MPDPRPTLLGELLSDGARLFVVSNRGPVTFETAPRFRQATDLDNGERVPFDARGPGMSPLPSSSVHASTS